MHFCSWSRRFFGARQGGYFCANGECGTDDCTFHLLIDHWTEPPEDSTENGAPTPLLGILRQLLRERKDKTIHSTLAAELAKPHRRAVANFIALHKPDHLFAKVLAGSGLWVQSTGEGHARGMVVDTRTACATSVTESRFKDFKQLMPSKASASGVDGVTKQQRHINQACIYVPDEAEPTTTDTAEPAEASKCSAKQKPKPSGGSGIPLTAVDPLRAVDTICARIKGARVLSEPYPTSLPPNSILFRAEVCAEKAVGGLETHRLDLFETHPEVKYLPGVSDPADISGGGPASVRDLVAIAKRRRQLGPLDMRPDGSVFGWDTLPGLERAVHVHREGGGSRPYNAAFGFMAHEKCHEFGLPYVDGDGHASVQMAEHESATLAHAFVSHVAQLTCPKLLVVFEHANRTPVAVDGAFCSKLADLVQQLGPDAYAALFHMRYAGAQREALLKQAFDFIEKNAEGTLWSLPVAAYHLEGGGADFACAVAAARMAVLLDASIVDKWSAMNTAFVARAGPHGEGIAAAAWLAESDSADRLSVRAYLVSLGYWFDVDGDGEHWPTGSPAARTRGPFAQSDLSDIARLDFKAIDAGQRAGFLLAPPANGTGFAIIVEGHTEVSFTAGHALVLLEAVRHALADHTVQIASASSSRGWKAVLPPASPLAHAAASAKPDQCVPTTLFAGTVVENNLHPPGPDHRRRFVGVLSVELPDGTVKKLTYRSVLVQDEDDTKKRKRHGVNYTGHRFPEVFGLDYSRRLIGDVHEPSGVAALEVGDEVLVTAYWRRSPDDMDSIPCFEVNHVVLTGGPEERSRPLGPHTPHGLAIVPVYQLTADSSKPRLDSLDSCLAFYAWPVQNHSRGQAGLLLQGDQGTGKSTASDQYRLVIGPNSMRTIKNMDKEAGKQFTEEFANSLVLYSDEVGTAFFNLCEAPILKDSLTGNLTSYERKHQPGMVQTKNVSTYIVTTNEMPPSDLGRRWCVVWCSNGLKVVGVGGEAARKYYERLRLTFQSPWINAGVLHFLQHYPICPVMEKYTADKSRTRAAMANVPRELHIRFLKFLVELPVNNADNYRLTCIFDANSTMGIDELLRHGWTTEAVIAPTQLKKVMAAWYKHVCARKEGNDRMTNVETTMLARTEALVHNNPVLAEMNRHSAAAGAAEATLRLTRDGLAKFLRSQGFQVTPSRQDFFFARV